MVPGAKVVRTSAKGVRRKWEGGAKWVQRGLRTFMASLATFVPLSVP